MADDEAHVVEHKHTIQITVAAVPDCDGEATMPGTPKGGTLTVHALCIDCGSTEVFSIGLHHGPAIVQSLRNALIGEGLPDGSRPVYSSKEELRPGDDMLTRLRDKSKAN